MLNLKNQYLKRICSPEEFGYYGSLMLIYEFPNGIKMYLIDTCQVYVPYCFVYQLYDANGRKISLRDKKVFYHYASFICTEEDSEEFFNRILKLGIDEEIEYTDRATPADEFLIDKIK